MKQLKSLKDCQRCSIHCKQSCSKFDKNIIFKTNIFVDMHIFSSDCVCHHILYANVQYSNCSVNTEFKVQMLESSPNNSVNRAYEVVFNIRIKYTVGVKCKQHFMDHLITVNSFKGTVCLYLFFTCIYVLKSIYLF